MSRTATATRPNKLLATFAAGAARPAPPMDDPTPEPALALAPAHTGAPDPTPAPVSSPAPAAETESAPAVAPVTALPTTSRARTTATAALVAGPPRNAESAAGEEPAPVPAPRAESPVRTPVVTAAPGPAVPPATVRVKQTVELPEDIYDQVQDFARGHRTSFQVLMRALLDDLLTGEDHKHRARLSSLIAVAEQEKRARKRRAG